MDQFGSTKERVIRVMLNHPPCYMDCPFMFSTMRTRTEFNEMVYALAKTRVHIPSSVSSSSSLDKFLMKLYKLVYSPSVTKLDSVSILRLMYYISRNEFYCTMCNIVHGYGECLLLAGDKSDEQEKPEKIVRRLVLENALTAGSKECYGGALDTEYGDQQKYFGIPLADILDSKRDDSKGNDPGERLDYDELHRIVEYYKPPPYLSNIMVHANSLEQAHAGIVYTGIDRNNKKQYVYGIHFLTNRKNKKKDVFLNMVSKVPVIEEYISTYSSTESINENLQESIYAAILYLSMTFYIRTGKNVYNRVNKTSGLLTLKKSDFQDDFTKFSFNGKQGIEHVFMIIDNRLSNLLRAVAERTPGEYIFSMTKSRPSETAFYEFFRSMNIRIKDIRTYGCNIALIKSVFSKLPFTSHSDMRKKINDSIASVAEEVGHTKATSKTNYIIENVENYFDILDGREETDQESFINEVISRMQR